ncbi:parvulin peptidyl-prolyl isomerase [Methylophaga sp. 42_25_T18]|nr:parvulin peptidyl-prolyl isomerase [Methylophaga sp. 42_25_T18]
MLHFIRERAQGWLAWFIVGLISIPFALWGINSYLGGPPEVAVASINDESISQAEFQQAMQQYREQMRSRMGEDFDPDLFDGIEIKRSVLNGLIEQKLLLSSSFSLGQTISDAALSNVIQSTPAFQKDGRFDSEYYGLVLARVGLSPARYEADLRSDLLTQELISNIRQTSALTTSNLDNVLQLEKQSRDIAYGVIFALEQLGTVDVADENVKEYFEKHQDSYLAPERVVVDYIELSIDQLKSSVDIDEDALKQFYADNEDRLVGPKQRRVSHILIEGEDQAALTTITAAKQRLDAGEDFAGVAEELSQDSGSAQQGGDLEFIQRGQMDSVFEDAAFALQNVGDVTDPVKTEFGYHLIKLTDIQIEEQTFADVREEVESLYRYQQAEDLFYDKAEQLADLSYENPENLDVSAEELDLEIKTTVEFTRDGGADILSNKKVVNVAFSEDVLVNDLNSAVIELSKSHLVVIHKNKHIAATHLPYESVAPAIKESLRFEQASVKAREQGEAIMAQLKSGATAESVFSESNWHTSQTYRRTEEEVSAQVLERAFSMAKPTSESQYSGFTATNGNYIVIKLEGVHAGNPSAVSVEERDGLKTQLARITGESELQAFIDSLRAEASIEVFIQNLN